MTNVRSNPKRATPSHHRCRSHRSAVHERPERLRRQWHWSLMEQPARVSQKSSAQWVRLNCCRCKVIRSFTMKSECRSSALAAASLSALGLYRRKITHTSTSIWAMPVKSSAPIALRYSASIRAWAHTKLIRQIVLTVTGTELKSSNAASFIMPAAANERQAPSSRSLGRFTMATNDPDSAGCKRHDG